MPSPWETTELDILIERYGNRPGQIAWDCRFAGYQVERALRQLDFAKADVETAVAWHHQTEEAFLESARRPVGVYRMTEEEMLIHDDYATAIHLLPFRIEVFVMQARVVLDRVARLLHFAFRPSAITIGSHSSVAKLLPELAGQHGVEVPARMLERITGLTREIKDLRDDYIVHPHGPYGHLIARGAELEPSGLVRLKIKWAPPIADGDSEGREPRFSEDVDSLDRAVRDYVRGAIKLIEMRKEEIPEG